MIWGVKLLMSALKTGNDSKTCRGEFCHTLSAKKGRIAYSSFALQCLLTCPMKPERIENLLSTNLNKITREYSLTCIEPKAVYL